MNPADESPPPQAKPETGPASGFKEALAAFECHFLEKALQAHRYNQRAAAKAVGLSYDQFRHALRRNGMLERESA